MKTLLILTMLSLSPVFSMAQSPASAPAQSANEVKVGVKGMVCAFCAQGIEKRLKSNKEVESVQVSLENKFVKIKFKDGQKLSNEKIGIILKEAGYEADFGG